MQNDTEPDGQWWLSSQGSTSGPFTTGFVRLQLKTGGLPDAVLACPVGRSRWKDIGLWPDFVGYVPPQNHVLPPAWNPKAIGWLALICGPFWCGIMVAINARRLGAGTSIWRPIAVTSIAFAIAVWNQPQFVDEPSLILDIALWVIPLALLLWFDLRLQAQEYKRQRVPTAAPGHWLWPAITAGCFASQSLVSLALAFLPDPPLYPREVCEAFLTSKSSGEAQKYTATNLWPVLPTWFASGAGLPEGFNLTGEGGGIEGMEGYLVGYRYSSPGEVPLTGAFQLVPQEDRWKIRAWYLLSVGSNDLKVPMPLSEATSLEGPIATANEHWPAAPLNSPESSATEASIANEALPPTAQDGGATRSQKPTMSQLIIFWICVAMLKGIIDAFQEWGASRAQSKGDPSASRSKKDGT